MTEPSWQPDPTGRNHYRWWDGANWSDSVSTNGQTAIDPLVPVVQQPVVPPTVPQPVVQQPAMQQPAMQQPTLQQPPTSTFASTPIVAVTEPAKKSSPLKWLIPALAVIVVGGGLFFFLGGDDDGGGGGKFGVTEAELKPGSEVATLKFNLKQGDVIRVRVEPANDQMDTAAAVLTDSKTSKAFAKEAETAFESDGITDIEDFFSDPSDLFSDSPAKQFAGLINVQTIDIGFEGETDADFFVAFAAGPYTVVVGAVGDEATGKVRIIVEKLANGVVMADIDGFSDFDNFTSDNEDFFSDTRFFSSDRTFTP